MKKTTKPKATDPMLERAGREAWKMWEQAGGELRLGLRRSDLCSAVRLVFELALTRFAEKEAKKGYERGVRESARVACENGYCDPPSTKKNRTHAFGCGNERILSLLKREGKKRGKSDV